MGLEILGGDPVEAVLDVVTSREETLRRHEMRVRTRLYRDDYQGVLREHVASIFQSQAVRSRLEPFIPLVGGSSFLKRVADEVARPLYARAPIRRVMAGELTVEGIGEIGTEDDIKFELPKPSPEQQTWNALAGELQVNAKHDLLARLLTPCPDMFELVRYVKDVGICLDVLTPDMTSVITHPEDPTRPLAIAYDSSWDHRGRVTQYIVWDDKRWFKVSATGKGEMIGPAVPHDFGLIPIVDVHRRARWGCFWDTSSGSDLVSTSLFSMLMDLIMVRKLKTQSHIQLAYSGEVDNLVKDQVSDEESILIVGGTGSLQPINLESNPSALLAAQMSVETRTAANHGISRERMNQKTGEAGEDVGLKERVAELAQVMTDAEQRLFKVVQAVSREHPQHKLNPSAKLYLDLGQLHNRVDRKTQLDVRSEEKSQGIRSAVDDVLEDNPEFGGDRRVAFAYLNEKAREQAIVIARQRALNMPKDATQGESGQDAANNGAMGPKVRDGEMTKEQAAEKAKTGGTSATETNDAELE
jgi:hypothetical protein